MANSNCLDGMQCPNCGSFEPFYIGGETTFKVYDDGVESHEGTEWSDESNIHCSVCDHSGTVGDFRTTPDPVTVEFRLGPLRIRGTVSLPDNSLPAAPPLYAGTYHLTNLEVIA